MPKPADAPNPQHVRTQLPIAWSERAARDRLSSTLFLAGLFHCIVILGVTFGGALLEPAPMSTSLDVVIVTQDYEDNPAPDDAQLLAQQNLTGAGNTKEAMKLETAMAQQLDSGELGPAQLGVDRPQPTGAEVPAQQTVIAAYSSDSNTALPEEAGVTREDLPQQRTLEGSWLAAEVVNEPAAETLISDAEPRELMISANTREARIAAYLNSWKRKVERMGTLNYPAVARATATSTFPTLEVAIRSDGGLREVVLRRSSGADNLDQAAMSILRDAAPFDPFPDFLRTEYDVLRFAYEWRFTNGQVTSKISVAEGS